MTTQNRNQRRTALQMASLLLIVLSSTDFARAFTSTTIHTISTQLAATKQQQQQQDASPTPKRRFVQPKFDKASNNNGKQQSFKADSKLMSLHNERIKTAGRKGTKRFVDPCKVFVGNLPYDVDSDQMTSFILNTMGQTKLVLHSSKVIVDWKTGQSKGFGFVEFTDPIFATVCMDVCNGKMLGGRAVSVNQGKKKEQESEVYLNKKKKKAESEEDSVIADALEMAESDDEEKEYEVEDLDVDEDGIAIFGDNDNEDIELDARLFGLAADDEDDYDDDDDGIDGIFLEQKSKYHLDMDPNLNREQRRDAARRIKKKKLPSKGFG